MKDQLENITPLAEKLQQITLPHVDENWEAMKTLLDKEMPVAQNTHKKRWLLVIILLLLFIGFCNYPEMLRWSGLIGKNGATVNYNPSSNKKETIPKTDPSLNSEAHSIKINGNKNAVSEDSVLMISHRKQQINKNETLNYSSNKKNQTQKIHQIPASGIEMIQTSDSTHNIADVEERNENRNVKIEKRNKKNSNILFTGKNKIKGQDLLMTDSNLSLRKNKTDSVSEDSVGKKDGASNSDSKKDKQIVEINAQHPVAKKIAKSDSAEDAKGFLFAVGFNQFFPVSHQKKINFNSNGGSGGLGDYIPVPVARYYFHKWLYVQAEAQFNVPQYTKELLASNTISINPIQDTSKSVFIKKLFYFNLPLSVHYSPIKNLYLGAGVQYSMLTNGIALFENSRGNTLNSATRPPDSLVISSKIGNIKSTPAYRGLRTNEFRFLFDVNYQWKPFTIGVRYNQAFTNFINVHISNTVLTQAHNASLQLYLRYTILDYRKKILRPK